MCLEEISYLGYVINKKELIEGWMGLGGGKFGNVLGKTKKSAAKSAAQSSQFVSLVVSSMSSTDVGRGLAGCAESTMIFNRDRFQSIVK